MERVLNRRLQYDLVDRAVLSPFQAGLRALRSTEDQLIRRNQSIQMAINKNHLLVILSETSKKRSTQFVETPFC